MPLVIAGPTASGKSSLALRLAKKHRGEIICADSRQFYARMSIGTACPSHDDMQAVPHHGYGILDPKTDKIDAGFFVEFATRAIADVQSRQRRPILVGGTGLYLRALYFGLADVPKSDQAIVEELEQRCDSLGVSALYEELKQCDPKSAAAIMPNDRYRIVRALEIFTITKTPPSQLRASFHDGAGQLKAHFVYVKPDRTLLKQKIAERVRVMYDGGLLEEAHALRDYVSFDHWTLDVMGYKEALMVLDNLITKEEAIERTIIRHRQYAKRQYTWFNKEPFFRWVVT